MDKKKNLLIAFCGPDGSGKTTLAKETVLQLRKNGRDVHYCHGHAYTFAPTSLGLKKKKVLKLRKLLCFLTPFGLIDNLFTYYFYYRPILKKKSLICDRYFYDKLARLFNYGLINSFWLKVYLRLLPKPDLVFFLKLDPQTIRKRKKEYSLEELTKFNRAYKQMAKIINAQIIKTNQPLPICLKKIFTKIKNYA